MKYKRKPAIIDAEPYKVGMEDGFKNGFISFEKLEAGRTDRGHKYPDYHSVYEDKIDKYVMGVSLWEPFINTLEGKMTISPTDYIVTGIKGERYPVKDYVFHDLYELAE